MDQNHLTELISIEMTYWWHIAKRELVIDLLQKYFPPPGILIEGGIGGGLNLLTFQNLGYQVVGFDSLPESVAHCHKIGLKNTIVHDITRNWPIADGAAKVILLLDVLEHIADPVRVLNNAARVLDRKGGIVFTVPAYPFLMGPWDQLLGHHRRYNTRTINHHVRLSGLKLSRLSYWNSYSLPIALALRITQRLFNVKAKPEFPSVPSWMNTMLINFAKIERAWLKRRDIPAGLSLCGVIKK